jgi:hypothetical protein
LDSKQKYLFIDVHRIHLLLAVWIIVRLSRELEDAMNHGMDFEYYVNRYYSTINDEAQTFPRLKAWEFVWVYRKSFDIAGELIHPNNIEKTALHVGFYLANWGMFRGKGELLRQNLDFFIYFSEILFGRVLEDFPDFYEWEFIEFYNNRERQEEFNRVYDLICERLPIGGVKDTLISKTLLGVWGQCPAFDTYFRDGMKYFLKLLNRERQERRYVYSHFINFSGEALGQIAALYFQNGWNEQAPMIHTTVNQPDYDEQLYPPAKLVDMAFWQYGSEG